VADEVCEIRPAAFEGGFRTLEIDGESWLLLGDVCRSLHMRRERALVQVPPRDRRHVHITQNARPWPYPMWVISEHGAMSLAATKEADRGNA
jgi:prophage antirepressor-like protein